MTRRSVSLRQTAALVGVLACVLGVSVPADAQSITTFDVPGAGTGAGQGSFPVGITPTGVVTGWYTDGSGTRHGFVRAKDGTMNLFDVPGAATIPWNINPAGEIVGQYLDGTGLSHGFVRSTDGTITTFDAPGASNAGGCSPLLLCTEGTEAVAINPAGAVSGQFTDGNGVFHGFLRSPDGAITTFDAPGAGESAGFGTFVTYGDGINPAGAIAAGYVDADGVVHAMVRSPDGAITAFDPVGSTFTNNSGINPGGTVTSFYIDASGRYRGYARDRDGTFTLFDVPGANTFPQSLNASGSVVGVYFDDTGLNHGFVRDKNGTITKFDVPGAGTGAGQGTIPVFNSASGVVVGSYVDADGVVHAFIRTP